MIICIQNKLFCNQIMPPLLQCLYECINFFVIRWILLLDIIQLLTEISIDPKVLSLMSKVIWCCYWCPRQYRSNLICSRWFCIIWIPWRKAWHANNSCDIEPWWLFNKLSKSWWKQAPLEYPVENYFYKTYGSTLLVGMMIQEVLVVIFYRKSCSTSNTEDTIESSSSGSCRKWWSRHDWNI